MADWKEQKEAFVTGHEGTSPMELLLIVSTVPVGWYCYTVMPKSIYTEVLVWIIPMIICQSEWLYPIGLTWLLLQLVFAFVKQSCSANHHDSPVTNTQHTTITIFRSGLMYLTAIAILAVDFRIFPRRFCKTEINGYSLMDLGAASFVVAAGLVSSKARQLQQTTHQVQRRRIVWKRILPLLFMAILRLVTHKGLEYPEHASEYGVHWNFFCTLAFLTMVTPWIPGPTYFLPILLLTSYQYALLSYHLQEWVENSPRTCTSDQMCWEFFVANREGVLGCIGYMSLYLISEFVSYHFIWKEKKLLPVTIALGLLWKLLTNFGIPVSRRTTNATFCIWTLFVCFVQLTCIDYVSSTTVSNQTTPTLVNLVNRNGLVTFIVANLMTGLVNLSVNSLEVNNAPAFCILFLYMTIVLMIVFVVDRVMDKMDMRTRKNKLE